MAGMNIDVSQARGDDRSTEEVLSTVDNKPFGMNLHVYVPPTIDDMVQTHPQSIASSPGHSDPTCDIKRLEVAWGRGSLVEPDPHRLRKTRDEATHNNSVHQY